MLNSSFGPRQNPCCNIQQRLHGQGPRIVLLACESMRSDQGGRKAVSNPFFPIEHLFYHSLETSWACKCHCENWKFFGIHSLQSPLVHQF